MTKRQEYERNVFGIQKYSELQLDVNPLTTRTMKSIDFKTVLRFANSEYEICCIATNLE